MPFARHAVHSGGVPRPRAGSTADRLVDMHRPPEHRPGTPRIGGQWPTRPAGGAAGSASCSPPLPRSVSVAEEGPMNSARGSRAPRQPQHQNPNMRRRRIHRNPSRRTNRPTSMKMRKFSGTRGLTNQTAGGCSEKSWHACSQKNLHRRGERLGNKAQSRRIDIGISDYFIRDQF
jgi:hypothetical protein